MVKNYEKLLNESFEKTITASFHETSDYRGLYVLVARGFVPVLSGGT
jgi:hypothetical protein